MPWRCPACRTEIRPTPLDLRPDPQDDYRCHVCHLDLRFNPATETMDVVPLDTEHQLESRQTQRTIPRIWEPRGRRKKERSAG
jgi:hypothetical protein